jgi:SAM-dependent methyltransferase
MAIANSERQELNTNIHPKDQMHFGGNLDRYISVGADALRNVRAILNLCQAEEPKRILDLASGCGRVLRHFRYAYPAAHVVASDLMPHAVEFCENELGAKAHIGSANFTDTFDEGFDLIWSGSLMTHLSEEKASLMLDMMLRSLSPGGLAIWTCHGRYTETLYRSGKWPYNISAERMEKLVSDFRDEKYGYCDYDHMKGYGISVTPLRWLATEISRHPSVRIVSLVERGWDNHQDVLAIQKRSI